MVTMEKITALAKSRGFVYPGSDIYGGLANAWDYGPLGVELKNNIKKAWWKKFVQENEYNVGVDAAIFMNPQVWQASGHLAGFNDPLMDCRKCKERFRADNIIEDYARGKNVEIIVAGMDNAAMKACIDEHKIPCPSCGAFDFTDIRQFNMMFKTFQGVTEEGANAIYLRPETAQGIFVNFLNVQRTSRMKIPFGIAQIGKSFRNEITPGNFIFRTREFEQMELQFFFEPGDNAKWFSYWKNFCENWLKGLGIKDKNLRIRDHSADELSHYSTATSDFEVMFPFGWGELWGIADRGNFDLTAHTNHSNEKLDYFDQEKNERYIPHVIEPSLGVERLLLALLCNAYDEEDLAKDGEKADVRTVLRLHHTLAPFKAAILPLNKNKLGDKAMEIYRNLSKEWNCDYDDASSIGKRYRRQDEIGTPFCITVDFQTVGEEGVPGDDCVTIRHRDSMEQERVAIQELRAWLAERLVY
ncbi:MAG: glycine--tRNA ligase [Defluviitaleaceae bacterium]|nr:glycine--tRNA ligase [Defluviitaleaceae bacterium]